MFVVARGHASVLFERAEEALHDVAAGIPMRFHARRAAASAAALSWGRPAPRNDRTNAAPTQPAADVLCVVAAVGNELARPAACAYLLAKGLELRRVVALPGRELQR